MKKIKFRRRVGGRICRKARLRKKRYKFYHQWLVENTKSTRDLPTAVW